MSVILHDEDYRRPRDATCTICGCSAAPPFVIWRAATELIICEECCVSIKEGLAADMIHCAAVHEINELAPYRGVTFERTTKKELDERERRRFEEENKIMLFGERRPKQ